MVEGSRPEQKPRVCIDTRLSATKATGVASYARAVVDALTLVGHPPLLLEDAAGGRFGDPVGTVDRLRRWGRAGTARPVELAESAHGLSARDVYRLAQVRFDRSGMLLRLIAPGPPGVMHWTYPIPARIDGWVNVYTVHDVIPLTASDLSPVDPAGLRRRLGAISATAHRIVTVSQSSRTAIIETLDVAESLVVDCGSAVTGIVGERAGAGLPADLRAGEYHLYCGLIEPRKNLARIVAGWCASGSRRPIVLVGPDGDGGPALRAGLAAIPGVSFLPYQPRRTLVALIAHARSLVFPTLEEGFGLPVAEAMALGTPVITSNRGALAETAGGAALLVDPHDEAAIGAAIRRIDDDPVLRADLGARGLVRAEAFSPARFAGRLLDMYAEAGRAEFAGASEHRP